MEYFQPGERFSAVPPGLLWTPARAGSLGIKWFKVIHSTPNSDGPTIFPVRRAAHYAR